MISLQKYPIFNTEYTVLHEYYKHNGNILNLHLNWHHLGGRGYRRNVDKYAGKQLYLLMLVHNCLCSNFRNEHPRSLSNNIIIW